MATRREINQQKAELKSSLREACRAGRMRPGEPAPPLRQLAEEFALSKDVAAQAMRELVGEGLFYSVPRKGTFVGRPTGQTAEHYLFLSEAPADARSAQLRMGFEDRIARLGGAPLCLAPQQFLAALGAGELPPLAGVYEANWLGEELWRGAPFGGTLARVRFGVRAVRGQKFDCVSFDDAGGARLATQHLLALGHKRVAFLGYAKPEEAASWSRERESGWRAALRAVDLEASRLGFALEDGDAAALRALPARLRRAGATAVVAANDHLALQLLRALRASPVPPEEWPSLVGFDDEAETAAHLVTSLRLPWSELGKAAADLLWERRHGRLEDAAQHRPVAMRLIPRLTCRRDWSAEHGMAALAAPLA